MGSRLARDTSHKWDKPSSACGCVGWFFPGYSGFRPTYRLIRLDMSEKKKESFFLSLSSLLSFCFLIYFFFFFFFFLPFCFFLSFVFLFYLFSFFLSIFSFFPFVLPVSLPISWTGLMFGGNFGAIRSVGLLYA